MLDTETLLKLGGLTVIFLMVYGQTGLFFCFFLPSGGFLFMAGLLIANRLFDHSLLLVSALGVLAAVLGNVTGYWIGRKSGTLLYGRADSRLFKQRYLRLAENFYKKHGNIALSISLFFPLIRTFGPMMAGIIRIRFKHFFLCTLFGAIIWVSSFVLAGYMIGQIPLLQQYIKYVVIGLLALVVLIIAIGSINKRTKRQLA